MNIAEKLVKLRKEKGITQEDLAQKLNISISAIRNYENTKKPREPKNDILLKFADFYNVSTEYLLNDNISNKTTDNIVINHTFKLSDKAIENIKNLQCENSIINVSHSHSKKIEDFKNYEETISSKSFNYFIENFSNLKNFTLLLDKLKELSIILNDLKIFEKISAVQFYITDCLYNDKSLDNLLNIYDEKMSEILTLVRKQNVQMKEEVFLKLDNWLNDFQEYCNNYKQTSKQNSNNRIEIIEPYLYEITHTLLGYTGEAKKLVCEEISFTQYQINSEISLFCNELVQSFAQTVETDDILRDFIDKNDEIALEKIQNSNKSKKI